MPMNTFAALGLSEGLAARLTKQGFTEPTAIQQAAIPAILEGKEVCAQSETGSGKTLAYLLPLFQSLDVQKRTTQALVLTPTHELAVQVHRQAQALETEGTIKSALIIGGANLQRQAEKLKEKPQLVIGSAGRILEWIQKRKIQAHTVTQIVLDEADRLLDETNLASVQAVVKTTLASNRHVQLFSASFDETTMEQAHALQKETTFLQKEAALLPRSLHHYAILTESRDKFVQIRKLYAALKPQRVMVFINNPVMIDVTVEKLRYHHLKADGLYGLAQKRRRQAAMDAFREGRITFLVATDLGARGLDFADVDLVINLDIPEQPVNYQHRAGRTGRNGKEGTVLSLATPFEKKWLRKCEKQLGISILEREMAFGKLAEPKKTKKLPTHAPKSAPKQKKLPRSAKKPL